MSRTSVAIYGAGIGGLSAAHELCKRRDLFDVHVYEAGANVGGKAASQSVAGTGIGGRADLPGEHGFRFFPAFYTHLDRTMAEIPTSDGRRVIDRLVGSDDFAVAREHTAPAVARRRLGKGVESVAGAVDGLSTWFAQDALDLTAADFGNFAYAMTRFLMSSERRRAEQYDHQSWYEFSRSDSSALTDNYRTLLASLPRTMVAMDGRNGSAYTIGKVGAQLFFVDPMRGNAALDRVLDGPTSESWLDPWHAHLVRNGVEFHFGKPLAGLDVGEQGGRLAIVSARLLDGQRVEADHHVCAIPVERLIDVIDADVSSACGGLRAVQEGLATGTGWMAGAQYFLRRDVRVCAGHVLYPDSPWALTSISQKQFWSERQGALDTRYGDGSLGGVLSVDISNWDAVAPRLGRTAKQCTRQEILDETFRQILDGLNSSAMTTLACDDVVARHLDTNIEFDSTTGIVARNKTPLFIHQPGAFQYRPQSQTGLSNLVLAADFVATNTNLASMEGANEAARRAVGHILGACGARDQAPFTRAMQEPAAFKPFRRLDRWLMSRGFDFADMFAAPVNELSELVAEAERKISNVSIDQLKRRLARPPLLGRFSAAGRPVERAQEAIVQLRGSLSRAERLVSRRSVLTPRHRASRDPASRNAFSGVVTSRPTSIPPPSS